jgi:transglutaminase-like putative cysteine protease
MTTPGRHAPLLAGLPTDIRTLTGVGHGLVIHEHLAHAYGVEQTLEERQTVHLRHIDRLLDRITQRDDRPLAEARGPQDRTAANCRHFTVLLVTLLRAQGVRARARCGFGGWFGGDPVVRNELRGVDEPISLT